LKSFLPAILWALIILVLSAAPGKSMPPLFRDLLSFDKLAHAAAYFVLTALTLWGLRMKGFRRWKAATAAAAACALYGVIIEIMQFAFFPQRYFEVNDIIANIIGCIAGLIVLKFIKN
jgi:VanZ family protein